MHKNVILCEVMGVLINNCSNHFIMYTYIKTSHCTPLKENHVVQPKKI